MQTKRYLWYILGLVILIGASGYFFSQPNSAFIKHACFMEKMDAQFGIHRDFNDKAQLLKQQQTLLPHLRRRYVSFFYRVPDDLHARVDLLQQPSNSLGQLRKDAEETQARLTAFLNDFGFSHQDVRLFIPSTKSLDTITHLLVSRWAGDASRITDYARATIAFPTVERMYQGLEKIKKSGLIILSIRDNFQTPCLGGYRDITVIFRDFVNGHIGEIQLNTCKIMEFKTGLGTELFHIIRKLIAIPKLENRPITENEKICLEVLFSIEKEGYDTAFELSHENKDFENSVRRIAIYSGSFDPPTKAHREIILKTIDWGKIDQLIVYVNRFGKKLFQAPVEDRKKMLELMLEDYRDKVSISIQTQGDKRTDFRRLKGLNGHLALVLGEDSYQKRLSLSPIQLAESDKLFVIPRNEGSKIFSNKMSSDIEIIPLMNINHISSTVVRESLSRGELPKNELEPVVLNYILSRGLYAKGETDECAIR